jgi:polyisoprenoid-binding protein YceI
MEVIWLNNKIIKKNKNNKMKNNIKKNLLSIAICSIVFIMGSGYIQNSQATYNISNSKLNDMKLSGTSTFHDWTMDTKTFTGQAQFSMKPGSAYQISAIKSLTFSLAVSNLKSGESGLDNNAYKALKTNQFKNIAYNLLSATILPQKGNKCLVKTQGSLSIAGVTKPVSMDVYCTVNNDGTIACTGSDKLNMTDYQVKPPTFMLGAMKTGNAITLDFTLVYKK